MDNTFPAVKSKPIVGSDDKQPESRTNMAVSSVEYNHKIDGQSNSVKMSTTTGTDSDSQSGGVTTSGRGSSHGPSGQDIPPSQPENRKRKTSDNAMIVSSTPTIPSHSGSQVIHVMTQKPKKGSFQITRVINRKQMDLDGVDHAEDADSIGDDFDETNTEDLSSEIMDTSKMTDIDQDPSSEDTVQSLVVEDLQREAKPAAVSLPQTKDEATPQDSKHKDSDVTLPSPENKEENTDPNFGENRFRIVKVPNERFLRGRWTCYDYHDSERTIREKSNEDLGSGNSSAASSVHYIPGVDDPSKNPLAVPGATSTNYADNASMSGLPTDTQPGHSVCNTTNGDYSAQPVTGVNTGLVQATTEQQGAHEMSSSIVQSASAISQPISSTHSQPSGSFATASGSSSGNGPNANHVPNTEYTSSSSSHTEYIGQQTTNQQQPSTKTIPQQQTAPSASSQAPQPAGQDRTNGVAPVSTGQGQTEADAAMSLQPKTSSTNVTDFAKKPASVAGSAAQSSNASPSDVQGSDFHPATSEPGVYMAGAGQAADDQQSIVSVEDDRGSDLSMPPLHLQTKQFAGMQGGLAQPLLEMALVGQRDMALMEDESGASTVAIDNKIEQAMDLVKSHLMFAVREEVLVLKEQIKELLEKNTQLEYENSFLRKGATPETLSQLSQATAAASQGAQTQSSSS